MAEPTASLAAQPIQPWYYRTAFLLSVGVVAIAASLVVLVVSRAGDGSASTPTAGGDGGGGTAATVAGAERYELAWLFKDPNRSLGDGMDARDARPAVWAFERLAVVASVDAVRGHSLRDGSVRWERAVEEQVCSAATGVGPRSKIVVIGQGEGCRMLTAISVRTGEVTWQHRTDELFGFESITLAGGNVFTLVGDEVVAYDAGTGSKVVTVTEEQFAAEVGGPLRAILEPPLAPTADGSAVVISGLTIAELGVEAPEPVFAFGLDARTGRLRWSTEVLPANADAVPHARDGAMLIVGDEPGRVLRLDPATGAILSSYDVPADSPEGGRPQYERYPFDGPGWYRSGVELVGGDPVLTYEQVSETPDSAWVQHLVRIDGDTGEEVWRLRPEDIPGNARGTMEFAADLVAGPMLGEGRMLVLVGGLEHSYLAVIDVGTGKPLVSAAQPKEVGSSRIQEEPGLFVVEGGVLLAYNPGGGNNSIDEAAEEGTDAVSLVLLRPVVPPER